MDTIDIEELANDFKDDFVSHFTRLAVAGLTAEAPWLLAGGNFLLPLVTEIVKKIITLIGTTGGLILFMFNTKVFTADQGQDWLTSKAKLKGLPDDVSDAVWDAAEEEANHAFVNLINVRK